MYKNDVETVLKVLCDCADDFKEKLNSFESYLRRIDSLKDSLQDSNLSPEDKFSLGNLVFEKSWELSNFISEYNQKIVSIDLFVSEINDWFKYDNGTRIMVNLMDDDVCANTL